LWSYEEKCRKEQEATGRHWDHDICSPYQNAEACAAAGAYGSTDGLSTTFTPAVAGDQNADPPIPDTHAECEVKLAGALPCDCEGEVAVVAGGGTRTEQIVLIYLNPFSGFEFLSISLSFRYLFVFFSLSFRSLFQLP